MNLIDAFRTTPADDSKIKKCLDAIVSAVYRQSGVDRCIRFEDNKSVAFAGTKEVPELFLELGMQLYDKRKWLCASLDNDDCWHEWDFEDIGAFVDFVAQRIAPLVNHTVMYVTEIVRFTFIKKATYIKDTESDAWIEVESNTADSWMVKPFLRRSERKEVIKEYCI